MEILSIFRDCIDFPLRALIETKTRLFLRMYRNVVIPIKNSTNLANGILSDILGLTLLLQFYKRFNDNYNHQGLTTHGPL